MARGIHVRYVGDGVHRVAGLGVFQHGTVGFAPRDVAIALLRTGLFEAVSDGPTAQAFVVRVGQQEAPARAVTPRAGDDEPADFERELEAAEREFNK